MNCKNQIPFANFNFTDNFICQPGLSLNFDKIRAVIILHDNKKFAYMNTSELKSKRAPGKVRLLNRTLGSSKRKNTVVSLATLY